MNRLELATLKIGSHDPFLDRIIFLSSFQFIEKLVRTINFSEIA